VLPLLQVTAGASASLFVQLAWLLLPVALRAIADDVGAPTPQRHSAYTLVVVREHHITTTVSIIAAAENIPMTRWLVRGLLLCRQ
jgi:hypothetical protein